MPCLAALSKHCLNQQPTGQKSYRAQTWCNDLREVGTSTRQLTRHLLGVTVITSVHERDSAVIALQECAGHADPGSTVGHIRQRERLSTSPAYLLKY